MIFKKIFQSKAKRSFGENYGECKRIQRQQFCSNQKKKELLSVRTKMPYNKIFSENLLDIETKKTLLFMNKAVYLDLSILEISKIVISGFWYYYVNPEHKKQKTFTQTLTKMLKQDLILQSTN